MHVRRALLYMPGSDRHKIEKALTLNVDCICMDMEDGVSLNRKSEARQGIAAALRDLPFGRSEKLARINAVGSGLELEDIETVLPCRPDGVVVPKVETLEQVRWASDKIEAAELAHGWPLNSIRMLAGVETARAILNLKEIASHPRLDGLIFGGEDYAASVGAVRTLEAMELLVPRSMVVTACAVFGLQAIDMVTLDFHDLERVRREAAFGAQLGYSGKQVIHPAQVGPVQEVFTPDDEAIRKARQVVEIFEARHEDGQGVFALDGKMVDMPVVKAARGVLERARAAGRGDNAASQKSRTLKPGGKPG
jgi:citrate lyase beta subunit